MLEYRYNKTTPSTEGGHLMKGIFEIRIYDDTLRCVQVIGYEAKEEHYEYCQEVHQGTAGSVSCTPEVLGVCKHFRNYNRMFTSFDCC